MTVATFQAVTATPPSATTGTLTVPWPTTHAVNDVGFLVVVSSGGGTTETLSTAAGFVLINTQTTGTGTAGVKISVYWCRATSTAMASPVVAAGTDFKYGLIATYRGLPTTGNPYATFAGNVKATASTSWSSEATLAATSSLKYIVVNFVGHDLDSTAAAFSAWAGTGMTVTERFDAGSVSGLGGGIAIADAAFQGGATTVPAFTATVTSSINAGIRLALARFAPVISLNNPSEGYVGSAYTWASKSALASAGTGTWSISVGALPPGLTIDSATGVISGTPTTVGAYSFTISVTDGLDTVTSAKAITVSTQGIPFSDDFAEENTPYYTSYAAGDVRAYSGSQTSLNLFRLSSGVDLVRAYRDLDGFVIGQQYTLTASFKWQTAGNTGIAWVGVDGLGQSSDITVDSSTFTSGSYTFTATATTHRIVFGADATGGATNVYVGDFSVAPVGVVHTITATVLATAGSIATAALVGTATTTVLATAASSAAAIRVGIATATVVASAASTATAFRVTAATVTAGATAGSTATASLVTTASATVLASAASSASATLVRIATVTVGATVGSSAFAASDNSAFVTVSAAVGSTAASQAVWVATTTTGATTNSTATAAATLATTSTVPATVTSTAPATLAGITTTTVTATAQATAATVTTSTVTVTVGATASTQLAAVLVELVLTNITVTATLLPRRWDAELTPRDNHGALIERDNTGTLLERTNTGTLTPRRWEGHTTK